MENHISVVSKLDGIRSWSLMSRETCPGSLNEDGSLVEVCRGCYAGPNRGNYRFDAVKNARRENKEVWQKGEWVDLMAKSLQKDKYFRWFDSGDIYCRELAEKILEVVKKTPNTKHLIPTRSYKIPEIKEVLEKIKKEPNAVVRYSSDKVGEYNESVHGAVVSPYFNYFISNENVHECEAYNEGNENKCSGCRKCWNNNVKTVAFLAHGQGMKPILNDGDF